MVGPPKRKSLGTPADDNAPKAKKQKTAVGSTTADGKVKSSKTTSTFAAPTERGPSTGFSSVLSSARAETDFPRGGGTILHPIEVKQARREAEDELFKQEAAAAKVATPRTNGTAKKRKFPEKYKPLKEKIGKNKGKENDAKKMDHFRVEHLNYKRCVPGTRMLGEVVAINALDVILSLPNQMLGHLPVQNVSQHLNKSMQDILDASESSDAEISTDEEEESESEDSAQKTPTLHQIFTLGQILCVAVVEGKPAHIMRKTMQGSRRADELYRMSRRLELSLDPSVVYKDMSITDLVQSQTLTASVKSIEDNGYLLDLGIEHVTAFASFSEGKRAGKGKALHVGQPVMCQIVKLAPNGRTCSVNVLSPFPDKIMKLSNPATVAGIIPGSTVQCLVTAAIGNGLNVKFLGLFDGSIELTHVGPLGGRDVPSAFKIGKKVTAKVLWTTPGQDNRTIALTLAPHLIDSTKRSDDIRNAFPIGRILETVHVTRLDPDFGISCEIRGTEEDDVPVQAFCHLSKIGDEHIQSLHGNTSNFAVGSTHRARVIGYSALEQIVQVSFQPSVLDSKYITATDVTPGSIVKGTVTSLTDTALFLNIGGSFDAIVWPVHYSDIKLKHPERKFKPGAIVKAKVFSVRANKQRINLTLKKTIVHSDLPPVLDSTNAQVGKDTDAVISRVTEKSLLIDLLGGPKALVPIAEASNDYIKDLSQHFTTGQSVKVRIMAVNTEGTLLASIRQAFGVLPHVSADNGTTTETGEVKAIDDQVLEVLLQTGETAGIKLINIANLRKISLDDAKILYKIGQQIDNLSVKRRDNKVVHVSFAKIRKNPAKSDSINLDNPRDFDSVQVGQTVSGIIKSKNALSFSVQISRQLKGRLFITDVADDYDQVNLDDMTVDSRVTCKVIGLDTERKFIDLCMRPSVLSSDGGDVKDPIVSGLDDLADFQTKQTQIRGFVKQVSDSGVFVALGRDITARVQITNLFDDYVKDWKPRFAECQLVSGKITAIDLVKHQVEMSLRTKDKKAAKQSVDANPWASYTVDQQVSCIVKREESYGFFLRIDGTNISGLCHKSEVLDGDSKGWSNALKQGQSVQAVITQLDPQQKRIAFSVKPSLIQSAGEVGSEEDEDGDVNMVIDVKGSHLIPTEAASSTGEDISSDDSDGESDTNMHVSGSPRTFRPKSLVAPPTEKKDASAEDVAEFEKMLLGSPNSSLLWIQFMSYYLSLGQIPPARVLARRALKIIDFRQQEEKNNVWIAMLNLESTYGTEDSLDDVFAEAVQANNGKHMHLKLLEILQQTNNHEKGTEIMQQACSKYGQSSKVWTTFANHLYAQRKTEEARDLLPRALKVLPNRKHVKTVSKFAQTEFRLGDPERGRTLFEGILTSHPKHIDVLAVYIDMEVKRKDIVRARALYSRGTTMKLSSKKAKWLFKRFVAFEKSNDNEEGVEAVKVMAQRWVADHSQAADQ